MVHDCMLDLKVVGSRDTSSVRAGRSSWGLTISATLAKPFYVNIDSESPCAFHTEMQSKYFDLDC